MGVAAKSVEGKARGFLCWLASEGDRECVGELRCHVL
jgi:hypothetical protein